MASSIHEIAAIIGEENADTYLVPIFENFAKDAGNVKLGLLNHLYDFFKVSSSSSLRRIFEAKNFYLKLTISCIHFASRQCILLCDLYEMSDVNQYLAAIALTLANGTFFVN
ncbi:unnamed protein product [Gongylonema pulchrum]|uniref:Uncharacterized protein n=1 Tax=Gongylonema pulchrum TaxID=637853 RepID=A0A3P7NLM5_9BILA|nr:unnamed protein product [Gongylonema pulchrum]